MLSRLALLFLLCIPAFSQKMHVKVLTFASEIRARTSVRASTGHRETRGFNPRDKPSHMRLKPQTYALTASLTAHHHTHGVHSSPSLLLLLR